MPENHNESMLRFVRVMAAAMDAGDPFTHGRPYRCSKYARCLGKRFGLDEKGLLDLEYAGLLQDLGKKVVMHGIFQKAGPLNIDETTRMAMHTTISAEVLQEIPFLRGAAEIIASLNERYDGGGRPAWLKRDSIPLGARILAVVSAFDAMTSDRPYRQGLEAEQAYAELQRESGGRFDPQIADAVIALHKTGGLFSEFDRREALLYMSEEVCPPGLEAHRDDEAA